MEVASIEYGAVLRRHNRAMGVVLDVCDEDARWELLEAVVAGNSRVEAALEAATLGPRRRPGVRPVLTDRHRAVVRMRNEGLTFAEIAQRLGYANKASARYAYCAGVSKLTA